MTLTVTPAVKTCALEVASAGMDGTRTMVPVLIDVEVAGPGPYMEPRDGFLDLKSFLMLFISMMIKVKEKELLLRKWS